FVSEEVAAVDLSLSVASGGDRDEEDFFDSGEQGGVTELVCVPEFQRASRLSSARYRHCPGSSPARRSSDRCRQAVSWAGLAIPGGLVSAPWLFRVRGASLQRGTNRAGSGS